MRLCKTLPATLLIYLSSATAAFATSPPMCSDILSETPPQNSDYTFEFTFGDFSECLPDTAKATIVAYAFDNRTADGPPASVAATWGPSPVSGVTTLRPGLRRSDLLVALQGDGELKDVDYYFNYRVDLNGDGEICNGDLRQDYTLLPSASYPATQLSLSENIPLTTIENTPCNKTPLQARNLDEDPSTIEAFYDASQNITWLADANLGASQAFGFSRGEPRYGAFSYQITGTGAIESKSIEDYMSAMNASGWLGHSAWRLPTTRLTDGDCSDYIASIFFVGNSTGSGCRSEMGNLFLAGEQNAWSNGDFYNMRSDYWSATKSTIPNSTARYNFDFGSGTQSVSITTGRYGPLFYVWPVHDGDIGTAIVTSDCIDTDGDGWGWDGQKSCKVTVTGQGACDYTHADSSGGWGWNPVTRESCPPVVPSACVDSDGDGWGWDGVKSCRVEPTNCESPTPALSCGTPVCVDTVPLGNGWGWDGTQSCRTDDLPD